MPPARRGSDDAGATRVVYSTDNPPVATTNRPPRPSPQAGAQGAGGKGGVRIRLDRRASDRLVTVVTGLPGTRDSVAELARALKAACGTGGTFKDGVVELQGDQREAIERVFAQRGIRSKRSGG